MNASLSATVPMLMNIKKRHLVVHDDNSKVVKSMNNTLTEKIDRRWNLKEGDLESSIYVKAAILDPRFKKLSFFTDQQMDRAYSVVANLAESLAEESATRPQTERDDDDTGVVEESEPTQPPKQRERGSR